MSSILVTRPLGSADPLVERLQDRGYRVHAVPTVVTEPVGPDSELDVALRAISTYDWVVVTSALGAHSVAAHLAGLGSPLGELGRPPRWAAVGPATAEALRRTGATADAVPPEGRGSAIVGALLANGSVAGRRFLLARADRASHDLPERLREVGGIVDEVVAYRTVEGPEASRQPLGDALADPDLAGVVFASGSAVEGYLRLGGEAELGRLAVVTIGGVTSGTVRAAGFAVASEATSPTVDALVEAVARAVPLTSNGSRVAADRQGAQA